MSTKTDTEQLKLKSRILKTRRQRRESQAVFWKRLGVTQSGGSRYERLDAQELRNIPAPVAILFDLVYGTKPLNRLAKLRGVTVDELIAG